MAFTEKKRLLELSPDKIVPNPAQPRLDFPQDELLQLAESIRQNGVLQPILVTEIDGRYRIIAGERRWRASRLAELEEIPAIVRPLDEITRMEAALIENIQREDLNPLEEALAVRALISRLSRLPHEGTPRRFSAGILRSIVAIALPSTLQQSFVSVGNIIIQSVINGYGPAVIAGYSAAIKLNNLVITSLTQLGNGMSNYVSQNIGADKRERIAPGFTAGLQMVYAVLIPVLILYVGFPSLPISVVMDGGGEAMRTGVQILRIICPFYLVVCVKLIADGVLRGAGLMRQFMVTTFSDLVLRVGLCIAFSSLFGVVGVWCSWPVGWCAGTALSVMFYVRYRRTLEDAPSSSR